MVGAAPNRANRAPHLVMSLLAAAALAILTLPSALNLPQSNPATVLEYAPVPPSSHQAPQQGGALSSLGLGDGNGLGGGEGGSGQQQPAGTGSRPITKLCVGNPPRQTEDPLSPPCVGYYSGNNGGATYLGVTGSEIDVVFYNAGWGYVGTSQGNETDPTNEMDDLWTPPQSTDTVNTRVLRVWQNYFNYRYQTYGRRIHFYVYYGNCQSPCSPSDGRADAATVWAKVHPFAVIQGDAQDGLGFRSSMASKGVMNFGGVGGPNAPGFISDSFYAQFPGLSWSFLPSSEQYAATFASYICSKVAPYPVSFSGDPTLQSKPRKYGLIDTTDDSQPGLEAIGPALKADVARCGIDIVDTAGVANAGDACCFAPDYAAQGMAKFKGDNITTILWAGGYENQYSKAASAIGYLPEWITLGDYILDENVNTQLQDQAQWKDAVVVTQHPLAGADGFEPACEDAYRATYPAALDMDRACAFYANIRQLFDGIQVAGPQLNPKNIDAGFHAIPPAESRTAYEPACFYLPGDYSCVKDAMVEWWNPNGNPGNQGAQGCWMMMQKGERYYAGKWPPGPVMQQKTNSDPCNPF